MKSKCTVYNYADDNTLSFSHTEPMHVKLVLEESANAAISWFNQNSMKGNPSKSQGIIFKPNQRNGLKFRKMFIKNSFSGLNGKMPPGKQKHGKGRFPRCLMLLHLLAD